MKRTVREEAFFVQNLEAAGDGGKGKEMESGKKILVIQGGGRAKGNTAQLVESFVRGAEDAGHTVEVVSLLKYEVKGCIGCNACRYGKPCVQKDDFNGIAEKPGG